MNIGLFTDTYFPQVSGVATSIQTLKQQLEARGHQVYIFTSTDPKVKKGTIEPHVYRFSSIPFMWFKDRRMTYRGGVQALKIAKELNLDLVHTQTEFSLGLIGKSVARKLKIPIVHTFHTNYEDYLHYIANGKIIKPAGVASMARYYMNGLTGIISPSTQTEAKLLAYKVKAPIHVIPTGVQVRHAAEEDQSDFLRKQLGLTEDVPVVVSIGRVAFEKDLDTAISVFAEALHEVPEAMFVIVGDGPAMSLLEAHVADLGIEDNVIFVGEVKHEAVYSYYRLGDVFVSASTSETQGLTFIEAMTAETPVVAIESPYMADIVTDENIGTLASDSYELIAPLVRYLQASQRQVVLGDPTQRERILHEIDAVTFGERVDAFYEEALTLYHEEDEATAEKNDAEYVRSFLHPFRRDLND